jgi:hypothetical protein
MKSLPSYLAPSAAPSSGGRSARILYGLQQQTRQALRGLSDAERSLGAWEGFSGSEKKAAEEALGIDASALVNSAKDLLSARPESKDSQKAVTQSATRKQK